MLVLILVGGLPTAGSECGVGAVGTHVWRVEVLALLAGGLTNREIGAELFISDKTASVHVSRILAKLSVPNRAAAATAAHHLGIKPAAPPC